MRTPSHAPAVRYPYGRSMVVGRTLAVLLVAGLACTMAWLVFSASTSAVFKAPVGLGLWLMCAAVAGHWWRRFPAGLVAWDGGQWSLVSGLSDKSRPLSQVPRVHLDLQDWMLLSARPVHGRVEWLWLERRSDDSQWQALRRAVFSRARPGSNTRAAMPEPAGADTMHAMPSRRDGQAHNRT